MAKLTPIKRDKFEVFLRLIGCTLKRTKGDHLIYSRPGLKRPIVITADKEIPVFIIRNNLRTLEMSPDEYTNIIEQL
ncbi:MAG: hypothetical protein UV63_C0006G0005 [Microgenomates group bacterium GW2011_GWC1_43_11]|uniref:YcfA family protein n=2 Tax=Candidatus Gottesmaniibacteriota TaxID=1752720 RepID=A0A0G1LLT0_9BACT|nr:MAG: hypothetical protein UV63_C0006G0005 [Microgenomates group bacterium GW2011_GWC1_43_11]KKT38603.1 MAG: hypothetical protein UW22_C0009G0009 [Candidatus Gottesmanbacteria bacterium GW2011_GWB1_44_11c]KKT60794.1 MAG: hypothetical protein UW52_C0017G0005 [Candidatus Gottesmanbacteria bacterium GW2011_GWA1_44_24b]HCM82268.1 hypothetical protein [Patescibacteria group bacterium]